MIVIPSFHGLAISNRNFVVHRPIIVRDFRRYVFVFSKTFENIFILANFCQSRKIGQFFYYTRTSFLAQHCQPIILANFHRSCVMHVSCFVAVINCTLYCNFLDYGMPNSVQKALLTIQYCVKLLVPKLLNLRTTVITPKPE